MREEKNKKLYEDLTYEEKYKIEAENKIKNLEQINEIHRKTNGFLRDEIKILEERIDKAIAYVSVNEERLGVFNHIVETMIEILIGGSNE